MSRSRFGFRALLTALALSTTLSLGCAWQSHMKQGDVYMEAHNYDAAAAEFAEALRLHPDDEKLSQKLAAAEVGQVESRAERANLALDRGYDTEAIQFAAEAYAILPTHAATTALIDQVVTVTGARARALADAGTYAEAMAIFDAIALGLPSAEARVRSEADIVRGEWVAQLTQAAADADGSQLSALAHLYRVEISALSGEGAGELASARLALDSALTYRVELDPPARDAGAQAIAASLMGERGGALLLVSAKGGEGTPAATLKLKASKPKFTQDRSARSASAQYQSGTRQVENPFYKSAVDDVSDEERRLMDRENDVTKYESDVDRYRASVANEGDTPGVTTGAEQNLSNAQSRLEAARRSLVDQRSALSRAKEDLARTDPTTEEAVYSTHTYEIVTHVLSARASMSASLTHADARPALTLDRDLSASAQDDAHPAQNIAGIGEDPLSLPSRDSLALELWAAGLPLVGQLIADSFWSYREAMLQAGHAETDPAARLEWLVRHVLTSPAQTDPAVIREILELSGVPAADTLLRAG